MKYILSLFINIILVNSFFGIAYCHDNCGDTTLKTTTIVKKNIGNVYGEDGAIIIENFFADNIILENQDKVIGKVIINIKNYEEGLDLYINNGIRKNIAPIELFFLTRKGTQEFCLTNKISEPVCLSFEAEDGYTYKINIKAPDKPIERKKNISFGIHYDYLNNDLQINSDISIYKNLYIQTHYASNNYDIYGVNLLFKFHLFNKCMIKTGVGYIHAKNEGTYDNISYTFSDYGESLNVDLEFPFDAFLNRKHFKIKKNLSDFYLSISARYANIDIDDTINNGATFYSLTDDFNNFSFTLGIKVYVF
ncbi:hypothetical protein ACFL6N_03410 [Thermodesulfobacteriota bacterium]